MLTQIPNSPDEEIRGSIIEIHSIHPPTEVVRAGILLLISFLLRAASFIFFSGNYRFAKILNYKVEPRKDFRQAHDAEYHDADRNAVYP